MKICFMCDLHLPFDRNALQYDVLAWAIDDLTKKKADCIIFAGDMTADGNMGVYQYCVDRLKNIGIPFLYIPGNSDLRDVNSKKAIYENASDCLTIVNGVKFFALNDSDGRLLDEQLDILEQTEENSIVFMHHPTVCIVKEQREKLLKWRTRNPKTKLFFGHEHRFDEGSNFVSLQAMDPDKAIGENPCITYYDTETERCSKSYYFCPVPTDLYGYMGISCYKPQEEIRYAINKGLKCLELRPNVLSFNEEEIIDLISEWRKLGNTNLSIHLSEIRYENGLVIPDWNYQNLVDFGVKLKAERFTQHVPVVSVKTVKEDAETLDKIAVYIAKALEKVPREGVLGIENMHMTKQDEANDNRRFGYTPEETLLFMQKVKEKCQQTVGINFDIGHARNNAPYSQKYQISTWLSMLGQYIIGYHLHQVKEEGGVFENHTAIDDVYGRLISFASFFRCWSDKRISHAPAIFEMRTKNAYPITLSTFEECKK